MRSCGVMLGCLAVPELLLLAGTSPLTVTHQLKELQNAKGLQQVACKLPEAVMNHCSFQLLSFFRASEAAKAALQSGWESQAAGVFLELSLCSEGLFLLLSKASGVQITLLCC